ncbi:MAG TPA: hypothetical protein VHO69_00865 [Phototrophicaceae bacterium]|nr:hypothetical protein [Phototrophicaceae bacterium]
MRRLCRFLQISCLLVGGLLILGWPQSQLAARIPPFHDAEATATFTPTFTLTRTWTPQPTATQTWTPAPAFLCERVTADNLQISERTVTLDIRNDNQLATVLTNINFHWRQLGEYGYTSMYVSNLSLNGVLHWQGQDFHSPTNISSSDPEDQSLPPFQPFPLTGEEDRTIGTYSIATWGALFSNGPTRMENYTTIYDYAGTTFTLYNPVNPMQPCVVTLSLPTPTPTPTFDPNVATETPTELANCNGGYVFVRFVRFETYGLVRLEVVNSRNTVAHLTGFVAQWKQATSGIIRLARVNVAAQDGFPGSVSVWQAKTNQDTAPPTTSTDATEGRWLMDYSFSPKSTTTLFLDFDGTSETLDKKGITPADFNGSQFITNCWHGGGFNVPTEIPLDKLPTSTLNLTWTPTNTPLPTMTPSKTPSPTITGTPELFRCERITAALPQISGTTVTIDLRNDNQAATYITDVRFQWSQLAGYPNLSVSDMALNGVTLWHGQDFHPPTNTHSTDPEDQSQPPFAETSIAARTVGGQTTARWGTFFTDGPAYLENYTAVHHYAGTYFTLYNPADPANPCLIPVSLPTATPTISPQEITPTWTSTPDCDPSYLAVEFAGFENYGLVRLNIVNNRSTYAVLEGFTVNWAQSPTATLNLARVNLNAAPGMAGSVQVWQAASGQDSQPPTTSTNTSEGTWLQNYGAMAHSVMPLYLDFDGTTAALDQKGITALDFGGTSFTFSCNGQIEEVVLAEPPEPTFSPTPITPTRTWTPASTANYPTETATWLPTPDCEWGFGARLVEFEPYGVVRLEFTNSSKSFVPFTGFSFAWKQSPTATLNLARVNIGAVQGMPGSVQVWQASSGQDGEPPTTSTDATEGAWLQNYSLPPNSITSVFFDFDGTTEALDQQGITPYDFMGTRFSFECNGHADELVMPNPPPPTAVGPTATWTPSITMTRQPSPTRMPTLTPSQTFTPSRTPTRIPTITPTFRPTQEPDAAPTLNYYTGDIILTWGRVPWAAQYYVQLDTDATFSIPFKTHFSPGDTLQWRVTGLQPGVYFWRVCAIHAGYLQGDWSLIGSFVVGPQ